MVRGSLICSHHVTVKFRILRGQKAAKSRITTLGFRKADLGLFRDLVGRIPWEIVLERRGGLGDVVGFRGSPPPS